MLFFKLKLKCKYKIKGTNINATSSFDRLQIKNLIIFNAYIKR